MSYEFISAQIEEFQQASWVADLVSAQPFAGSFTLADGSSWTGTAVSERFENLHYYTRVIGGANKLTVQIPDKYYAGNVSLQVAVGDICTAAGESIGSVKAGTFLNTYQRQIGSAADALNAMAEEFGLIWWIDRTGRVNMDTARPTAPDATGSRVSADVDASILLIDPSGVVLGAGYDTADATVKMPFIQHVRWSQTDKRFSAQIYPVPFLFRSPVRTVYSSLYSARVDKDNGDGTIDVIADARFGVTQVPLLCGVPHAKVKVDGGDLVTLGFFGGDPQKPFAVAMGQDTSASKKVARDTDPVKVTLDSTAIATLAPFISAPPGAGGGPCTGLPGSVDVNGTIQGGTTRISVGD